MFQALFSDAFITSFNPVRIGAVVITSILKLGETKAQRGYVI